MTDCATQNTELSSGDVFEMFSISDQNNTKPVKVLEVFESTALVLCGAERTTMGVDLIQSLDKGV
jgi:hypothetical protein